MNIHWPDDNEKKEIAKRIFLSTNRDWINCIGVADGTLSELYKSRCVAAIRRMKDEYIHWPDDNEKKEIAKQISLSTNRDWINCIAVADGTLFPLTYAPQSSDAPDYHGQKHLYSLLVMIVNDDMKRIRMYNAGTQDVPMTVEFMDRCHLLPTLKNISWTTGSTYLGILLL